MTELREFVLQLEVGPDWDDPKAVEALAEVVSQFGTIVTREGITRIYAYREADTLEDAVVACVNELAAIGFTATLADYEA